MAAGDRAARAWDQPRKKLRAAVVLALAPGEFDGGLGDEDDYTPDYWSVRPLIEIPTGDPENPDFWHFNPRHVVRPCDVATVNLFFQCGGLEGLRVPPQAGGMLDQAAIMIDAFSVIGRAVAVWNETRRGQGG